MFLAYPIYARHLLEKKLCIGYFSPAGRNFSGRICVHHKGGGSKSRFKFLDFFRRINNYGWVIKIFKTRFRSAFLGLIIYKNGLSNYILLTHNIFLGEYLYSGTLLPKNSSITNGITLPITYMNLFSVVCGLELKPFCGIKLMRSAGMGAVISTKNLIIYL